MRLIITLSTVLRAGGSAIDLNFNSMSPEIIDAAGPEIVKEVQHGRRFTSGQLFFAQMHVLHLFGRWAQQLADTVAVTLLAVVFAASFKFWKKASNQGQWWYKDAKGLVRGPFSTLCMKQWRATGYLPDDLEIKDAGSATFVPLRELFPAPAVPFQSPTTPLTCRSETVSLKEEVKIFGEDTSAEKPDRQHEAFMNLAQDKLQVEMLEEAVLDDMLHDQHEAFMKHGQDLEDEMIMTLEAELEESVGGQPAHNKVKNEESWNSLPKPQVVDEEVLAQICAWRGKRQLLREEMAQSQMHRHSRRQDSNVKRTSSEERIQKQFNTWCCNELMSEHQAALDDSLLSMIESR